MTAEREPSEGWDDAYRTCLQHYFRYGQALCGSPVHSIDDGYHYTPSSYKAMCRKCAAKLAGAGI